jgi:peptidoglycan/LPS O-acetylase OafA/YrhL
VEVGKWLKLEWDRVLAWAFVAFGAIALIAGWVGVSGSPYAASQLPYIISGGIGGIFLLGVGATLWLSADLRDEWRKLDCIEEALRERQGDTESVGALPD